MCKPCSDKVDNIELQLLIDKHFDRIEAAAKRVLGPDYNNALDDLRQEVGIAIWRILERGQTVKQWEAFIYHCAHKRALDLLKQARRRRQHEILINDITGENPSAVLTPVTVPRQGHYPLSLLA